MKRYFRLYSKFLQQYIKSLMEYRIDFIFGLIGFILIRLAEVVFIKLIFKDIFIQKSCEKFALSPCCVRKNSQFLY